VLLEKLARLTSESPTGHHSRLEVLWRGLELLMTMHLVTCYAAFCTFHFKKE